jgi:N-acetylglucosamine kinase-like BadF-type ATPase
MHFSGCLRAARIASVFVAAIDHSGATVHTCGLGQFTDDFGGGFWYGGRAVGTVYNELYKLGQPTIMKDMLFELIGINRREDYLEVFLDLYHGGKIDTVALNSIVFNAAARGDAAALKILGESAGEYADAIARLVMDFDFPAERTVYVTLAGSVFVKQKVKILQELIEKRIADTLNGRPMEYILLDAPPVMGAVIWAAQKAGFNITMSSIKTGLAEAGL